MAPWALVVALVTLGSAAQATPAEPLPAARVSINLATSRELVQVPGVGELLAQRIIAGRPFRKLEDLRRVPGMSSQRLARLRRYLKL